MITLTINGEARSFEQALTCKKLLEKLELVGKRVAIEKNIGAFLDLDLPGRKVRVGGPRGTRSHQTLDRQDVLRTHALRRRKRRLVWKAWSIR